MLQSEICRRRAPIAEVAETLSETAPGAAGRLFANLRALLPMMDTLDFRLLWKRSVAALGLESDEVYALERLGLCLGRYEAEAQSSEIEACIRRISALETRAGERAASGGRLYTGLGVTLGLMTAVLIV